MAQNPSYIPAKDNDAGPWAFNFDALLTANPTNYGLVAGDAVAASAVIDPWVAALALVNNPATKTPVTVAAKDAARAAMESVVRPLAVAISQNPSVSGALKTGIGVTNRILTRSRNSVVAVEITPSAEIGDPIIQFRGVDPATPLSAAKPLGALGWEIQVEEQEEGPTDAWVTVLSVVATKQIFSWDHTGVEGFRHRFKARWVGASLTGGAANQGPWSPYQDLSVP